MVDNSMFKSDPDLFSNPFSSIELKSVIVIYLHISFILVLPGFSMNACIRLQQSDKQLSEEASINSIFKNKKKERKWISIVQKHMKTSINEQQNQMH